MAVLPKTLKFMLITASAVAIGLGLAAALRPMLLPVPPDAQLLSPQDSNVLPNSASFNAAPLPRHTQLGASIVLSGGATNPLGDALALADGARFQLRLSASEPGTIQLFAISPSGERLAEPLWQGEVAPGSTALTPTMRLEGERGVETLQIVHTPAFGGHASVRNIRVLHV